MDDNKAMGRHADPFDAASELEAVQTQAALTAARSKNRPEQIQNSDGTWPFTECIDCDEPIVEARLALGKVRCVECQEIWEKTK